MKVVCTCKWCDLSLVTLCNTNTSETNPQGRPLVCHIIWSNPDLQLLGVSLGPFTTQANFHEACIYFFRKTGTLYLLFHDGNLGLVLISCHQKSLLLT